MLASPIPLLHVVLGVAQATCYPAEMPTRSSTKPHRDLNQVAKFIVDQASGEVEKEAPPHVKNEAAVALGRLGGKKGGAARAAALTPEQRSEIAKIAAAKRWGVRQGEDATALAYPPAKKKHIGA